MLKKISLFAFIFLLACKKDPPLPEQLPCDIFLIAGQSNTHQGPGLDSVMDAQDQRIVQLGRFGAHNEKVIAGREPLEHSTALNDCIGFGLTFAKEYWAKYRQANRRVLLVPCGFGSTGFAQGNWNKGDALYRDAVERVRYALSLNAGNKLVAILWHQGESDIGWPGYQQALDMMIVNMRKEINGDTTTPFLLGGMVPYWVGQSADRQVMQSLIAATPQRVRHAAFVSPYHPYAIQKSDTAVAMHYDAAGQRELGRRYFAILDSLLQLH